MHIVNLIVEIIVTCYCTALDMVHTCPIVYMYDVSLMISVTVNDIHASMLRGHYNIHVMGTSTAKKQYLNWQVDHEFQKISLFYGADLPVHCVAIVVTPSPTTQF